jgi:hypothetical protein
MKRTVTFDLDDETGDVVLQEIWRTKDKISAQYKNVHELIAALRKEQEESGRPTVDLSKEPQPDP